MHDQGFIHQNLAPMSILLKNNNAFLSNFILSQELKSDKFSIIEDKLINKYLESPESDKKGYVNKKSDVW